MSRADRRAHDPEVERERVRRRLIKRRRLPRQRLRPAQARRAERRRGLRQGLKRMPLACSVTRSKKVTGGHGSHFLAEAPTNSHRLGTESVLALKLSAAYVSSRVAHRREGAGL